MAKQPNGFDDLTGAKLLQAIQNGDEEEACLYISRDVDVNKSLQNGRTVLMLAAQRGQSKVVDVLIAAGAYVNADDGSKKTALMDAAENGHTNVLRILSDNGAEINRKDETGRTALMLATEGGHSEAVDVLLELGAKIHIQSASDKETALTLVREERVLLKLIQSSIRNVTEEDIRNQLKKERTEEDPKYFLNVFQSVVPDALSSTERSEINEKLKQIPVYKSISDKLVKSGGYDVRQIQHPQTRKKIHGILHTVDDVTLTTILQKAAESEEARDGVFSMIKLMAEDETFTKSLSLLLTTPTMQNLWQSQENSLLNCLAEAGLVDPVIAILNGRSSADQADGDKLQEDLTDWKGIDEDRADLDQMHTDQAQNDKNTSGKKVGESFLHHFAQKHSLGEFFSKIGTNQTLKKMLTAQMLKKNADGDTFLAVAVKTVSTQQKAGDESGGRMMEATQDTINAMEIIAEKFGEETLFSLLMPKSPAGNTLLHVTVQESCTDLIPYLLLLLPDPEKILNQDGYNILHLAVHNNNPEMVKLILESDKQNRETPKNEKSTERAKFDVNSPMANGETALHIAAQFGYCDVLGELIDHGGDLSIRDAEDGHTPLHDCLQQVYFEGGAEDDEKCEKFFKVWDNVVEKAVSWWCIKQSSSPFIEDPDKHFSIQCKAVYYLRSCIENNNGLSVLQFAADRGLVGCVQKMLATKDVFVLPPRGNENLQYSIDITNLCPEYSVNLKTLYSQTELKNLGRTRNDTNVHTFLEALVDVKPQHKAGEILESIPMMTLSHLEWKVCQWIYILWLVIHLVLMILVTKDITSGKTPEALTMTSVIGYVFVLIYASFFPTSNILVRTRRFMKRRRKEREQTTPLVRRSIRQYNKVKDDKSIIRWVISFPVRLLYTTTFVFELSFAAFTWTVYIQRLVDLGTGDNVWIKGLFLLFGWLVLLAPLTSYSPVFKLISVLRYTVIYDLFPWIIIYLIFSTGFATAVLLQFQLLPSSAACLGEGTNLMGFLNQTGNALYELVIITSGLESDLKGVRNIACLFESHQQEATPVLVFITTYAIISAVVFLNMLIAIMSNTVTEAQNDKGWRQYQIHQSLWIREFFQGVKALLCSRCCHSRHQQVPDPPSSNIPLFPLSDSQSSSSPDDLPEMFLDRRIRGKRQKRDEDARSNRKWNKYNIRYDHDKHRWYLKLDALDVKEIRAKIWQYKTG